MPRIIDFFNTSPRIRTEGEETVLHVPNGMAIALRPDGTCTLRGEGKQDREYPTLNWLLADPELLREMRDQRRPYFEVRPFIGLSELLDEIVASPARVSIRRNGKTEYLIRVNGHGFRMSNRGPDHQQEEDQAPPLLFRLADPQHMPGRNGRVEHTPEPGRPGTLEGLEGKTQETSAAMAGMSQRSARKWQCGPLPSETKQERWWRTRPDPFDGVWEEETLPLLQGEAAGKLRRRRDSSAGSASPSSAPCNGDYKTGGR